MKDDSLVLNMLLGDRHSSYILGPLATLELNRFVGAAPPVYVVDDKVARLHPQWLAEIQQECNGCQGAVWELPGGEEIKSLSHLARLYDWLARQAVPRDGTIVGIGGGTVLDLVGFAASSWRRGVNLVTIPTTLLAMVDASLGGKTAINTSDWKNSVGSFYPASGILADCCFLTSLPRRQWRNGMAELIKTAVIGGPHLFQELHAAREDLARLLAAGTPDELIPGIVGALPWRRWVGRAAEIKAQIVERDFREVADRRALNLGHTLGHALESWSRQREQPMEHGEAVAIGLAVAFKVAAERGICPLPDAVQAVEVLEACGLPVTATAPGEQELAALLAGDKKMSAAAGLRWVLPVRIGQVDIDGRVNLREVLKWLG